MITFHVFLRIIALLQTPRPGPEGSMTGVVKAWTLKHWVRGPAGMLPVRLLIVPETSPEGTAWGKNKESWAMSV